MNSQKAVVADDISIALADEHIHHYHKGASLHLKIAFPVAAFAAYTASAAAAAIGPFAKVAWTVESAAVASASAAAAAAAEKPVTAGYDLVTAWNPVSAAAAETPAAAHCPLA